jgi:Tfp pilus assembly protein PilN
MIRINLLPIEKRPPRWHYGRLVALPMVAMLILLSGLFAFGEYRIWDMEKRITETRIKKEALARSEEQMRLAIQKQGLIGTRQQILAQLSRNRQTWHGTVSHLGTLMPRTVWVAEIGSAQRGAVVLKGNALKYTDLVVFFGNLEKDKLFTEPILVRAESVEKSSYTRFEITLKMQEIKQ